MICCLIFLLSIINAAAEVPEEWSKAAREIPYLSPSQFQWDRPPSERDESLSPAERNAVLKIWVFSKSTPREQLWKFTENEDPKIRTMALCAAFLQMNPADVAKFATLLDDDAATFSALGEYGQMGHGGIYGSTPIEVRKSLGYKKQTVGDFASVFTNIYLRSSGFRYGIKGRKDSSDSLDDYLVQRKDIAHCLGWYKVRLDAATGGQFSAPLPPERAKRAKPIRADINQLPVEERAWTLLGLGVPYPNGEQEGGAQALVSRKDLIRAVKDISRQSLTKFIVEGQITSLDPDISIRAGSPFNAANVLHFLLKHAREVLEEGDAQLLLDREKELRENESGYANAAWFVAAADIAPDRSKAILLNAFTQFRQGDSSDDQDQRCYLARAIVRHLGSDSDQLMINWFFTDPPTPRASGFGRHRFAEWLGKTDQRRLLKMIFVDPRAADLDWYTLRYLGEAVNATAGKSVLSLEQFQLGYKTFDGRLRGKGVTRDPNAKVPPGTKEEREAIRAEWCADVIRAFPN